MLSLCIIFHQKSGIFHHKGYAYKDNMYSDADNRTFWCKKLWIFQNLWCVQTDKGRGQFFAISCGRLLWTAPNCLSYRYFMGRLHQPLIADQRNFRA